MIVIAGGFFSPRCGHLTDVIAIIKNSEKAVEIIDFLAQEPIGIAKSKFDNYYIITSNYGYRDDNNRLLIKLAENNLIDNNFAKDENFEFIKSKYYYDKNIDKPERLKKIC